MWVGFFVTVCPYFRSVTSALKSEALPRAAADRSGSPEPLSSPGCVPGEVGASRVSSFPCQIRLHSPQEHLLVFTEH